MTKWILTLVLIFFISCTKKADDNQKNIKWKNFFTSLLDTIDKNKRYSSFYIMDKYVCESCFEEVSEKVIQDANRDKVCIIQIGLDSNGVLRNKYIFRDKLNFAFVNPVIHDSLESSFGNKLTLFQSAARRDKNGQYVYYNNLEGFLTQPPNLDSMAKFLLYKN